MSSYKIVGRKIRFSYAVLVIILCATVGFLTDYIIIDRNVKTCDCPKCESINSGFVESKSVEKKYSYDDLAGFYETFFQDLDNGYGDKISVRYNLHLYSDATFYYKITTGTSGVSIGTYTIDGNKIILNSFLTHANAGILNTDFTTETIIFNNNFEMLVNPKTGFENKDVVILPRIEKYDENNNIDSLVKESLSYYNSNY